MDVWVNGARWGSEIDLQAGSFSLGPKRGLESKGNRETQQNLESSPGAVPRSHAVVTAHLTPCRGC